MVTDRVLILSTCAILIAGCGSSIEKRACMKNGTADPLVTGAAMFRLDVYGAGVHCSGSSVPSSAGAPLISHTYSKGQVVTLDVPPGPHALVLTTYSDAAGTTELGQGCTEQTLSAGAQVCFDLTLTPSSPDLAAQQGCTPSPDSCPAGEYCAGMTCVPGCKDDPSCAALSLEDGGTPGAVKCDTTTHQCVQCLGASDCPAGSLCVSNVCVAGCNLALGVNCPSGLSCCSGQCVDVTKSPLNCGSCGNACSTLNASAATCTGGACGWTCQSGWAHCQSGNTGCETSTHTITNCGACNAACDTVNSIGAACPAGACTYTGCAAGWADCTKTAPDTNGCETHVDVDVDNCGACGRACSSTEVSALHCSGGLCDSSCISPFINCNKPIAPLADDGCEESGYDPAHCGTSSASACTNVCMSLPNETATCPAGTCGNACSTGYADCDKASANGCECPTAATAGQGTAGCCGTACQKQHANGIGQNFYDCTALGTYNTTEAQAACAAHTGDPLKCYNFTCSGATTSVWCDNSCTKNCPPCNCWEYGSASGGGNPGHVNTGCFCASPGDATWN